MSADRSDRLSPAAPSGHVVALGLLPIIVLGMAIQIVPASWTTVLLWAEAGLIAGYLAVLLANGNVRGVMRYTVLHAVRTKVAAVFVVLLSAGLIGLPMWLKGDGTLSGQIRTYLAYGPALTGLLLSVETILLAVGLVSGDVRDRHIFLTSTKPLARTEYLAGRWLGITAMNLGLLAVAAAVMFGTVQHLRAGETSRSDRAVIENEVFAARARIPPRPIEQVLDDLVKRRKERLGEQAIEQLRRMHVEAGRTPEQAKRAVDEQLRGEAREGMQSVEPGGRLQWRFEDVRPSGDSVRGEGTITGRRRHHMAELETTPRVARTIADEGRLLVGPARRRVLIGGVDLRNGTVWVSLPEEPNAPRAERPFAVGRDVALHVPVKKGADLDATGRARSAWTELGLGVRADPEVASRVVADDYLSVNGVDGQVEMVREDLMVIHFGEVESQRPETIEFEKGRTVELLVHPTMELSYEITTGGKVPGDTVRGRWVVVSPDGDRPPYYEYREDPVRAGARWRIPHAVVGEDGTLLVNYRNLSGSVFSIKWEDIRLYYRVGGFGWNFTRGVMLMGMQLAFLAALGVLTGSMLSFPVACFVSFVALPLTLAREFLEQAVKVTGWAEARAGPMTHFGNIAYRLAKVLLPDLGATSPGDRLADAVHIGWGFVGDVAASTLGVRALLLIGLAFLLFRRRELARVQV